MPYYEFWCECGATRGVVKPAGKSPKWLKCRECSERMHRDFSCQVAIYVPHMETGFTGSPIEVTSAKHRDELCRTFGVSADKHAYSKPKKDRKTIAEKLNYGDVKKELENHSDDDLKRIRQKSDDERRHRLGRKIPTRVIPVPGEKVHP